MMILMRFVETKRKSRRMRKIVEEREKKKKRERDFAYREEVRERR